jgi:hypothetical protein
LNQNYCRTICKCNINLITQNHIKQYHTDFYSILRILLIRPSSKIKILICGKSYKLPPWNYFCNDCAMMHSSIIGCPPKYYYCDNLCNINKFNSQELLNEHLVIHHKYTAYCDNCDMFIPNSSFNEHIELNHKVVNYCHCCDNFDTYIRNTSNIIDNNTNICKRKRIS